MKNIILFVLLVCGLKVNGQNVELGLRDSHFARVGYLTKYNLFFGLEQSLLNVKLKEQSGRLLVGYRHINQFWNTEVFVYGGTEYNGSWQAFGAILRGDFFYKRLVFAGTINPNYDTGLDFQFNYDVEAGIVLWERNANYCQNIVFVTSYGNIPEFRDNVRNLRVGMKFVAGNLWVHPEISIPGIVEGETHLRVLCNLGWKFTL